MSLTGQTVKDSYLDLVQLEQSGAGLPSSVGENARLYDGDGNPIVFRTARPHVYDVDSIASTYSGGSGTFEWETDKTKSQLESDGWVFVDTGVTDAQVVDGVLYIDTATSSIGNGYPLAMFPLALSGDFYFQFFAPAHNDYFKPRRAADPIRFLEWGVALVNNVYDNGDATTGFWYGARLQYNTTLATARATEAGVYDPWTKPGFTNTNVIGAVPTIGFSRVSGDLACGVGIAGGTPHTGRGTESVYEIEGQSGWTALTNYSESRAFTHLALINITGYGGYTAFGPIRRIA